MESLTSDALIKLLDDPDQMVFEAVSEKIQQLGPELLPDLELAARQAMSPILHERIEQIIKILQYNQLKTDLSEWINSPHPRLIDGAWLMLRYQFPDLSKQQFSLLIKPLRDEIWLEISDILTALEKIRIMNTLLYGKNRIHLNESHPDSPGNNFINRVVETGKANEHSLNLLYAILGQELGMPVFAVEMPDHPILSYVDMPMVPEESINPALFEVLFYINPTDNGSVHSRNDITNFLISQSLPLEQIFYKPRTNPDFIRICLKKLASDYKLSGSEIRSSQVLDLLTLWK
ncbi:MAG: transglutaminase family protein [Bacteroidales bacterium]